MVWGEIRQNKDLNVFIKDLIDMYIYIIVIIYYYFYLNVFVKI